MNQLLIVNIRYHCALTAQLLGLQMVACMAALRCETGGLGESNRLFQDAKSAVWGVQTALFASLQGFCKHIVVFMCGGGAYSPSVP